MKTTTIIKMILLPFIGFAIYEGHKSFFNNIPEKIKSSIPTIETPPKSPEPINSGENNNNEPVDDLNFKFSAQKGDNSLIGNAVSGALNKVLENPNGRIIVREVFQRIANQSQEITKSDLFLSRYLTHDVSTGSGKEALCGDKVEISYSITAPNAEDNKQEKELRTILVLGSGTLSINLESGIIGMSEGGTRQIAYPETLSELYPAKSDKLNAISAKVKLLSIKDRRVAGGTLGKAFFDKVGAKYVSGIKLICGDVVRGNYSITSLNDKVLYDSKKAGKSFLFRIGEDKIPSELSNAIMGLPAHKADVSFITSYTSIMNSFSASKDFLPKDPFSKKPTDPIILNFQLSLNNNKPGL